VDASCETQLCNTASGHADVASGCAVDMLTMVQYAQQHVHKITQENVGKYTMEIHGAYYGNGLVS